MHPAVEVHLDHSPFLMPLQITQLVKVFYVHMILLKHPSGINCFSLVSPDDYMSDSGILTFNTGDTGQCHNVKLVNDAKCEGEVQFISNLTLVTGAPVTVVPPSAQVIIFDDGGDCGCK